MMPLSSGLKTGSALVIAIGLLSAGSVVLAHKGATGVVKDRMMAMKDMGDNMKALSLMVTGKEPFDTGKTKQIASDIKGHAAKIEAVFPEGSLNPPSEALPKIWTDWDAFVGHAKDLENLAGELEAAAEQGKTASLAAFAKMGKSCSGCHEDFRQKKEKK